MTPEQLKASILQLAIQGKLVEQRPEEGTSEDLYQQIQAEKQKLIEEGKLKKEKPLPAIDDEIPFEIPSNWKWVNLSSLCSVISDGTHQTPKYVGNGVPFISVKDISSGVINFSDTKFISYEDSKELNKKIAPESGDILICRIGTLGKAVKIPSGCKQFSIFVSLGLIKPLNKEISDFIVTVINSAYGFNWLQLVKVGGGTHTYKINLGDLRKFIIPLPPLAEQKRIAAKIEELLPLVEKYKKAYSELEILNSKFSGDMKKSILQYAIQGKLVEQRPEEGTAEDLYQQIQEEKQNLIKEGKLKKEKPLAPIEDDEIPFEIPEHWKWARLSSLVSVLGDGLHGTPSYDVNGTVYFINGNNLKNGKIVINDLTKKVSKEEAKKYYKDLNQSSLLVSINGTLGNVAFYDNEPVILGKSACYFNLIGHLDKYFFKVLIDSDYFQSYLTNFATGTTIKNVPLSAMRSVLIPLPPLAEQKRIVAKVEELLALCDKLKLK